MGLDRMRILDGIEPHTSHTCCGCGRLFGSLGYSRVFQCANEECVLGRHASSGRDSNASRGIGLLNLGLLVLQLFGEASAFAPTPSLPNATPPAPAAIIPPPEQILAQELTPEQITESAKFHQALTAYNLRARPVPRNTRSFFASVAEQMPARTADEVRNEILSCMTTSLAVREATDSWLTEFYSPGIVTV